VPASRDRQAFGAAAAAVDFLVNFFEDNFSEGGSAPIPRQLRHGRHPLYAGTIGISPYLVVDQAGIKLVSAHGGPSIDPPLNKPEGSLVQVGFQQFRIVNMHPGPPIIVNNPDGSAAYQVTCHTNGTLQVDYFNQGGGHKEYPGGAGDVMFMGVRTTYVCHGYKLSYD
jgi:hypothetical protein